MLTRESTTESGTQHPGEQTDLTRRYQTAALSHPSAGAMNGVATVTETGTMYIPNMAEKLTLIIMKR